MTTQDHARIANRWLFEGFTSQKDRELIEAAKSLHQPFAALLEQAVNGKIAEDKSFVTSPLAVAFHGRLPRTPRDWTAGAHAAAVRYYRRLILKA